MRAVETFANPGAHTVKRAMFVFVALLIFVMLLTSHFAIAGVFGALAALTLGAWHWQEPEET